MKKQRFALLAASVAAALALTACGGGDDDTEEDPYDTGENVSLTVSSATNADLNGIYTSNNFRRTDVDGPTRIGEADRCRFRFEQVEQQPNGELMDGDIRYFPESNSLQIAFISIGGAEFSIDRPSEATVFVDKANDEVDFNGAVLQSTQGAGGGSITLTGSIPMSTPRPEDC